MPSSAQIFGRSAFCTPRRSILWLPVIFYMGNLYFSATSAMRRNSSGERGRNRRQYVSSRLLPVANHAQKCLQASFFLYSSNAERNRSASLRSTKYGMEIRSFDGSPPRMRIFFSFHSQFSNSIRFTGGTFTVTIAQRSAGFGDVHEAAPCLTNSPKT